jgi:hypothetical protein
MLAAVPLAVFSTLPQPIDQGLMLKRVCSVTLQAWSSDSKVRRKEYFKKSMDHHPDRANGNQARFAALNYAFRRANHRCAGFELQMLLWV